jgi:thiamine-monophosphate kinase
LPTHKLTEDEILKLFRKKLGLTRPSSLNIAGNTDDAAIMPLLERRFALATNRPTRNAVGDDAIVLTQDGMVDGVHFRLSYYTPAQAAAKCMAVNLSDLAAMGATPLGALVYVGLPRKYAEEQFVAGLADGLRSSMHKYRYTVFGGDLTSANHLTISAAFIGSVKRSCALLRSGAKPGDAIFLSGRIGAASLGLRKLESLRTLKPNRAETSYAQCIKHVLSPEPRVELGRSLAASGYATSCIDLSDSLSKSLLLLAGESKVGVEVEVTPRMLHSEVNRHFGKMKPLDLMRVSMSAEEDFELLFTADAKHTEEILRLSRGVFCIGRAVDKREGVQALIQDSSFDIPLLSYEHFGK